MADAALGNQDALRLASRTGRVNDISRRIGRDGAAAGQCFASGRWRQQRFGGPHRAADFVQARRHCRIGKHACGLRIVQADLQAFHRRIFVNRQPGRAGLGDPRLQHQQLDAARQPQADYATRPDAGRDQSRRHQVGLRIQFAVA